ncbi:MAG TPA: hypothetical protein PKN33_01190 [Phycisphaerae bacterium]|nr:hypothetical protein [Phycisphaerae bacterium]
MAKKKKTTVAKTKSAKSTRSTAKKATSTKKVKSTKKSKAASTKNPTAKKPTVKKKSVAKKRSTGSKTKSSKTIASDSKKKAGQSQLRSSAMDGDDDDHYEDVKIPKTKLTEKQLAMFRQLLIEKRRELLGDVRMLTRDALGKPRQESSGDLSNVPIHMADVGSDNWEQDFTIGLIANERQLVREIDEALARIEDRTYGVCLGTLKRISVARLRAKPWAKYSIEYARQLEQRR